MKQVRRPLVVLMLALVVAAGCAKGGSGADPGPADAVVADSPADAPDVLVDTVPGEDVGGVEDASDAPDVPEAPDAPDVPEPPSCDLSTAGNRIEISPDKPLFIFNIYGDPTLISDLKALLPADVWARFAIHYVPPEPYDFGESWQAAVEGMAQAADAAGIPLFVQVEHGNTRNAATGEYWHGMFEKHASMTGLVFAEICWTGLWFTGLDDDYIARMIADLDVVAAHGGYLLWQDMATDNVVEVPHVYLKAGADPGLMAAFRKNGRHVIVQDKHNGSGKRFVNAAAPMGLWASCAIGNWGVHSEDWLWWEAGYTHLFQPSSGASRSGPSWQTVMSFPDALFGIDWMAGLAGGATVFGFENPGKLLAPDGSTLQPAFRNVMLPLIRRMLAQRLPPTRDEARERMKVAYQPLSPTLEGLMYDTMFKGLYGPEESCLWEWLPSTGRYYYVPILPVLATPGERALFGEVVDSDRWSADLADVAAKQAFFDARYPSTGDGDAWFVSFPGRLFAFNPRENQNLDATLRTALDAPGLSLSAALPAHTSLLAMQRDDGLDVDLSNYRIDSEADVWTDPSINDDPTKYLQQKYAVDPTDGAQRRTLVSVEGLSAAASLTVSGDPRAAVTDTFAEGRHTVTVDHNGPVTLRLVWPVP